MSSTAVPKPPLSFLVLSLLLGALGFLIFFFFSSWKGTTTVVTQKEERKIRHDPTSEEKIYTKTEIAQHAKEDDAWVIIDGKVFQLFCELTPIFLLFVG